MPNPLFTPEQIKTDAATRVTKTAGQSGVAIAVVIVGLWFAKQVGWEGDMPSEVQLAVASILTGVAAALSNLGKLRGRG